MGTAPHGIVARTGLWHQRVPLHAAHDDLVKYLDLQNRNALRLARLSELFLPSIEVAG